MSDHIKNCILINDNLPKHIKKWHQLLFSRQDLSAREADLFALMIVHMSFQDWDKKTPTYKFSAHQLSEWLKIDSKHIGSNLSPVACRLSSRKVGIRLASHKKDDEFEFRPFFKYIAYKNGTLTMIPNDLLRTEYIQSNQGFALITTRNFFDLKKEYSKRLYELLSRFKGGGTSMKIQTIDDLKGLFGLLDESGKLRKDKSSYKNNSVFINRCIRNSIKELSTNINIKKELLFLESNNGEKGFRLIKKGRKISGLEFSYRWLKTDSIEELNTQNAKKNIRELELKRLEQKKTLTIIELNVLAKSYRAIEQYDLSMEVEAGLAKRKANNRDNPQKNIISMLEKIETLKSQKGNPEY